MMDYFKWNSGILKHFKCSENFVEKRISVLTIVGCTIVGENLIL
jgi:hypothetical protein